MGESVSSSWRMMEEVDKSSRGAITPRYVRVMMMMVMRNVNDESSFVCVQHPTSFIIHFHHHILILKVEGLN